MPSYLLDTNVVSEMRRKRPHQGVVQWLRSLDANQTVASAVTVGEIQYGIEAVREADVAKAIELETWLEDVLLSLDTIAMDGLIFREYARIIRKKSKDNFEDAMIAATARVRGLVVATRNVDDFRSFGVEIFNPFTYRG